MVQAGAVVSTQERQYHLARSEKERSEEREPSLLSPLHAHPISKNRLVQAVLSAVFVVSSLRIMYNLAGTITPCQKLSEKGGVALPHTIFPTRRTAEGG